MRNGEIQIERDNINELYKIMIQKVESNQIIGLNHHFFEILNYNVSRLYKPTTTAKIKELKEFMSSVESRILFTQKRIDDNDNQINEIFERVLSNKIFENEVFDRNFGEIKFILAEEVIEKVNAIAPKKTENLIKIISTPDGTKKIINEFNRCQSSLIYLMQQINKIRYTADSANPINTILLRLTGAQQELNLILSLLERVNRLIENMGNLIKDVDSIFFSFKQKIITKIKDVKLVNDQNLNLIQKSVYEQHQKDISIFNKVKSLLQKSMVKEALIYLGDTELNSKEVTLLQIRLDGVLNDFSEGTITRNEYTVETTRIVKSILEFLEK
jgi:hypothetical protein